MADRCQFHDVGETCPRHGPPEPREAPRPDPDARVKKGFRIGIQAAQREIARTRNEECASGRDWPSAFVALVQAEANVGGLAAAAPREAPPADGFATYESAYEETLRILKDALDGLPEYDADLPMPRIANQAAAAIRRLREAEALLAAARRERDEARALVPHPGDGSCDGCGCAPSLPVNLCESCRTERAAAEARERALREALEMAAKGLRHAERWLAQSSLDEEGRRAASGVMQDRAIAAESALAARQEVTDG